MSVFRGFSGTIAALVALAALPAALPTDAQAQNFNPSGIWRCVMNSQPVTIDLMVQVNPDQSLMTQGTLIYNGTSTGFYNIQAPGRWAIYPNEFYPGQYVVAMQVQPQNHAIFSIYPGITNDPGNMYNRVAMPPSGSIVETACQRVR